MVGSSRRNRNRPYGSRSMQNIETLLSTQLSDAADTFHSCLWQLRSKVLFESINSFWRVGLDDRKTCLSDHSIIQDRPQTDTDQTFEFSQPHHKSAHSFSSVSVKYGLIQLGVTYSQQIFWDKQGQKEPEGWKEEIKERLRAAVLVWLIQTEWGLLDCFTSNEQ